MVGSLSPMFGYGMSALSLSYHKDFYRIDVDELGYEDNDPRWIGAWWLGYLLYTVIFAAISIPFFFYPRVNNYSVRGGSIILKWGVVVGNIPSTI